MDIVEHCHFDIDVDDLHHLFLNGMEYRFNAMQQKLISSEIEKLLQLKVIQVTHKQHQQVISPIFLREKKNGEFRMVLNLAKLNKVIPYKHFKMENFEQAIRIINKGDFLASVDLRHAYYSVKVAEEQQKFLCFTWQGVIFQFTCLPNGISEGPRLFTKLLKPVFATLRKEGYTITSFIDDTLICSNSFSGCVKAIQATTSLLQRLGFCINEEKSVLTPTQCIEYLGNVINTQCMTASLPERRLVKIRQGCTDLLGHKVASIREVARVIGLLVAAIPAVELGKLHYRNLEAGKIAALKQAHGNFDRPLIITDDMKLDLAWWLENMDRHHRHIFRSGTDIDLFTDASKLGWGGHLGCQTTSGIWSRTEKELHINILELKAILLAMQAFAHELEGRHIKVFCDNTTAINYVNEMGGTKSKSCNYISSQIWDWCLGHKSWITCSHIPGKDNTMADLASRVINDRHEWKLDPNIFVSLCNVFGTPSIDLFASRLNKQVNTFCSWMPDPEATYFDAFSLDWSKFDLAYLFPPFSLIARCLQKLRAEQAQGWMVVPLWPSQPWMGMLLKLLTDYPRLLPSRRDVITHPSMTGPHPVMSHTKLMVCLLSGETCRNEEFRRQLQTSYLLPGSQALRGSTAHMYKGGHSFVVEGRLIPLLQV